MNHDTGPGHPERPDRLRASLTALQQSSVWEQLHRIEPTPASIEQIAYAHNPAYSEHIRLHCEREIPLTYDTTVCYESFEIALLSTGGVLRAADAVATGVVQNAFAMVRPPGHHATPGQSMGFCLFNNIAVTARYLQREHGIGKIAIVDWMSITATVRKIFFMKTTLFSFFLSTNRRSIRVRVHIASAVAAKHTARR